MRTDELTLFCPSCEDTWHVSEERKRYGFFVHNKNAADVAVTDFCSRMRAERLSALQGTWPAVPKEAR